MSWMKRVLVGVGIIVLIAAAFIAVGGVMLWKRPLKVDAMISRSKVAKAGLEKSQVDTPSGRMTVWEGGTGPCMVLLHGAGDQAGAWSEIVGGLVDEYHLVIPDLPGHWKSDPRDGPLGVGEVLDGLVALLETRCSDEPVILVGNSLGGWISLLYATQSPERVDSIIAINAGGLLVEDPAVNLFPADRKEAKETMQGLMGPHSAPIPGFVLDDIVRHARVGPAGRLAQTADTMGEFLLDGRLSEIMVPVDLVWGDADRLLSMDYARQMLEELPRARLHRVENCGHVPHRECPDQVYQMIKKAMALGPPELVPVEESAS